MHFQMLSSKANIWYTPGPSGGQNVEYSLIFHLIGIYIYIYIYVNIYICQLEFLNLLHCFAFFLVWNNAANASERQVQKTGVSHDV